MKKIITTIGILIILIPFHLGQAYNLPDHDFPRLVNLYWKTPLTKTDATKLAKWDMVALDMQAQTNSREAINYLRQLNPNIIILAYTSANEVPKERLKIIEPNGQGLWHNLVSEINDQWYLKTTSGKNISWWAGNVSMNLYTQNSQGQTYADYLADFYTDQVLSTGLWDGLLFDNTWQNVYWVNKDIDIDGDSYRDNEEEIDRRWREGHINLFENLRNKFGSKYLILGNGDGQFEFVTNGRVFEGFPEYYEGEWTGSMSRYQDTNQSGYNPRINIINSDTDNTGNRSDYRAMRYGLTSTLLADGYYSFDYGTQLREYFWWYDEYDVNLGKPKTSAFDLLNNKKTDIAKSIWQRDFESGVVLVNSTDNSQKIKFNSEYEKLHGTQDQAINNGAIINQLTIAPKDGIILLRPIEKIINAVFTNGSFARIFNGSGHNIRTGFFAYDENFRGSTKIIYTDIDHDTRAETIVANSNKVEIYNEYNDKLKTIYPYGHNYQSGISLATADINGDGQIEIITSPEIGMSNEIKIFNWKGNELFSFYAFNQAWVNLGANVAVGDISGDGEVEIIASASNKGGPHVRIFDKNGKLISNGFFAYDSAFRGGVNLATGDINGDGINEIITGPGFGGGPHVRIFNQAGEALGQWFTADANIREGIKVAVSDIDNDGTDEIITLTTNVFTYSSYIRN